MTGYLLVCALSASVCSYDVNAARLNAFEYETSASCVESMMGVAIRTGLLPALYDRTPGFVMVSICGGERL